MKILIADDDADARFLFEMAFEEWGCSVVGAQNGAQALERARASLPDLILSDVMMPEMDGFMFCRKVKEDLSLRDIPVILYTATSSDLDEEELARKLGAARFLRKPLPLPELRAAVMGELAKRRPASERPREEVPAADRGLEKTYMEVLSRKLRDKSLQLEQALARLARSEDMYRRLVENTPDIVYSAAASRELLYCSPRVEVVLGYAARQLLEKPLLWLECIHPDDRERVRALFTEAGGCRGLDTEYRIKTASGDWRWLRDRAICSRGDGGRLLFDGIASDITARKQAEQNLKESRERLFETQKLEMVGRLSGGVAHDLNNLLGPVLGYAESLGQSMRPVDPRQAEIREIIKAAERAARLVKQLAAFSRTQLLSPQLISINERVSSACCTLEGMMEARYRLRLELGGGIGLVLMDPGQLEQALVSLVAAARESMPDGGEIRVSTRLLPAETEGDGPKRGERAALSVKDSGPGLDEEARGRIFEPFFGTLNPGSGLRYPTVFGIVKQSGGEIRVASRPGEGTEFEICLPIASA